MLHCASVAVVVRPLALVLGVLPASAVSAGVAQIHGVVWVLNSTGPPIGWLVTVIFAPTKLPLADFAVTTLAPTFSPVTAPSVRPLARVLKADVTSVPSTSTRSCEADVPAGSLTSISTEPPLTRSARLDRVWMVVPGVGLLLPPQAVSTIEAAAAMHAAAK